MTVGWVGATSLLVVLGAARIDGLQSLWLVAGGWVGALILTVLGCSAGAARGPGGSTDDVGVGRLIAIVLAIGNTGIVAVQLATAPAIVHGVFGAPVYGWVAVLGVALLLVLICRSGLQYVFRNDAATATISFGALVTTLVFLMLMSGGELLQTSALVSPGGAQPSVRSGAGATEGRYGPFAAIAIVLFIVQDRSLYDKVARLPAGRARQWAAGSMCIGVLTADILVISIGRVSKGLNLNEAPAWFLCDGREPDEYTIFALIQSDLPVALRLALGVAVLALVVSTATAYLHVSSGSAFDAMPVRWTKRWSEQASSFDARRVVLVLTALVAGLVALVPASFFTLSWTPYTILGACLGPITLAQLVRRPVTRRQAKGAILSALTTIALLMTWRIVAPGSAQGSALNALAEPAYQALPASVIGLAVLLLLRPKRTS